MASEAFPDPVIPAIMQDVQTEIADIFAEKLTLFELD